MAGDVSLAPVAGVAQVADVARMARQVWNEYYVPLIGQAQVDYMVARFQTAEAMQAQIDSGHEYFWIREAGENIGYAAIRHDAPDAKVFISKLYVLAAHRKSGAGRRSLELIEGMARERRATHLWLTVNKANASLRAYERLGFQIVEAFVMDIGGGFVMDDYKMEKAVAPGPAP
jgi:diamine N-acetyltransferase